MKQCLCQRWLCLRWTTRSGQPCLHLTAVFGSQWFYFTILTTSCGDMCRCANRVAGLVRVDFTNLCSPVWGQSSTTLKVLFLWLNAGNRSCSPSLFAVVSDHSVIPTQVPGRDPAQLHGQFLDQSLVSRRLKSHSVSGVTGQLFVGPDSRQNDLQSKRRDRKTHEHSGLGLRNTQCQLSFLFHYLKGAILYLLS